MQLIELIKYCWREERCYSANPVLHLASTPAPAFLKLHCQMFTVSTEILPVSFSMESFHITRGPELPPAVQAELSAGSQALTGLPRGARRRAREEPMPRGLSARAHLGRRGETVPISQAALWERAGVRK